MCGGLCGLAAPVHKQIGQRGHSTSSTPSHHDQLLMCVCVSAAPAAAAAGCHLLSPFCHIARPQKLMDLAAAADLKSKISAMFAGEHINSTEDRAVLHVATRARRDQV